MEQSHRDQLTVAREKAVLAAVLLPTHQYNPHDPLDELRSLAETAGAVIVDQLLQNKAKPDVKSFMGKGKVSELSEMVKTHKADVVIFDNDLTPSQLANIEEIVECKVLDRSELILDIFAARAQTHEAKLQVELAQMQYTYPRLRAMWSHLERIAGGSPVGIGTRGPGEQQLEIDRRLVQKKVTDLKREIAMMQARKTREVAARNEDFYTVGIVGYTSAGKSTFFNTATGADSEAHARLFTTLSTRTRKWSLGQGDTVMLSDTVGFVKNLPHHLVASFRATLEEAVHSDLLLIVLDVSQPRARQMLQTVFEVLDDVGATDSKRLVVLNKIDLVEHAGDILVFEKEFPDCLSISAKTGRGMDVLVERVRELSRGKMQTLKIAIDIAHGKAIHFLETRAQIVERSYEGSTATMTVRIGTSNLDRFMAMGAPFTFVGKPPKRRA